MTKRLLTDSEYTVTSDTTITIDSSIAFGAENLNLIIDNTDNRIVYNFACEDLRATVSSQTITLVDTTIDTSDSLTIIMSFEKGDSLDKLDNIILWDSRIESLLKEFLEEQRITNKYLKKIYNPE
jgi:hypothetical protein